MGYILAFRVINLRDSLDAVPIVPYHIPLGDPLKERMFWSAMALEAKAKRYPLCYLTEAMLEVAGEG